MSKTIYQYRIWCETEGIYKYSWGTTLPTTCPTDTAHTVTPGSANEIDSLTETTTIINTINNVPPNYIPLGSYYRLKSASFTAAPNATTTHTFSYPYPIAIISGRFITDSSMTGDVVSVGAGYDTAVSTLTANATAGDTTISINPAIINSFYMRTGGHVRITDGVNTTAYSNIVSQNPLGTITLSDPLAFNFTAGSAVQVAIIFADSITLGPAGTYDIGASYINSTYVSGNIVFRITYVNNTGSSKLVSLLYDFLY